MSEAKKNTTMLRSQFQREAETHGLRGIIGVVAFSDVYNGLMDVQKLTLQSLAGDHFQPLLENGCIVSFAYVYPDGVVDKIGHKKDGLIDKESWNVYARWYTYLNEALDATSKNLAETIDGIPITATASGIASLVSHVSEYFSMVVSHRVHAEKAGIGWRGKNSLMINPRYSCMIRLSGIITETPLIITRSSSEDCGDCTSCEEACTFLQYRQKLEDYREQCRIYLDNLGLDDEVCGKCIKACVYSPRLAIKPEMSKVQPLDDVYYTHP
ncbi:MAG: hypothetical protein NWE89_15580 [Candidatus Bathyarchaeota archaeon]|nr:hypothetical protein [Candidatus Bathyarchaeota archaeon]